MLDVKALRHAMLDADCTTKALAEACKICPSAMYRRLNGSVSFTLGEINRAVDRLHLTTEQRNRIFFAEKVS